MARKTFEIKNPCRIKDLLAYAKDVKYEENRFIDAIHAELQKGHTKLSKKHVSGVFKLLYTTIGEKSYIDLGCMALSVAAISTPIQLEAVCLNVVNGDFGYLKAYKGAKVSNDQAEEFCNNIKQVIVELQVPRDQD